MKLVNLSTVAAAACLFAMTANAADDLASAFKEGKLDGRIRAHYMNTNWDHNEQWNQFGATNKPDQDSHGLAVGGSLIYKTAPVRGLSAGAGFYTTHSVGFLTDNNNGKIQGHPKNTTAADLFARGPGADTDFGTGYSVLGQAYLQYDIAKTSMKGGRMIMNNPFISANDTKMIPIAVQGGSVISTDLANTTIELDYVNKIKERGMTYFGSMADTGDTPDAIKNYYRTHYTTSALTGADLTAQNQYGQKLAPNVAIAGVKNKSIENLELQGWFMNWPDIINQAMGEANYKIKAGDVGITLGARYMQQMDHGAGDLITPHSGTSPYLAGAASAASPLGGSSKVRFKGDNDNRVDTYMYALRAVANYQAARFLVAYARTAGGGDLIAPWRAFPTEGYTRSMTQSDWNANTKSYKAQADYDFNAMVPGLSAMLSYSFYNRDESKTGYVSQTDRYYGNGDTRQYNFDVKYAVASVKGLELKMRTMIQQNAIVNKNETLNTGATASDGYGNDTSNKELRVEVNYLF